ncbi:LacI family DNA-binding transcriptional regulator [Desertivirga xinjiangensis]|uniref:LacI family DNA-binding transcriptional regulator n=1 Tax=Desertivirga xinjiangensis TaxID=539206 RepID=UPI00210E140B|nr:LacI family DNA-binding transcriptional regulator [Pedobacter xinjiangensis]
MKDYFCDMKKHQITIVDIAQKLGISKSTVSRALTGHPSVHQQTRERVLKLAEEMDYERNMLSIGLIKNSSLTIGIIVPEFTRSFFPKVIIGAQEKAKAAGYNLIICHSEESYETEVANTKVMLLHQVDGLLISITKETTNFEHLKVFQRKGIPIVFFNRVCEEMVVPKVIVDDEEGAFSAVQHLIKRGKKRVAFLNGPANLHVCKKRGEGYKNALQRNKLQWDEQLLRHYDLDLNTVEEHVNFFLGLQDKPDAIFAINDPTAIEVMRVLKKKQIRIPEDIAVVGFSNDMVSSLIEPGLTTVEQPVAEIGRVAAQLLLDQIKRNIEDWKAQTVILKTKLIQRDSS